MLIVDASALLLHLDLCLCEVQTKLRALLFAQAMTWVVRHFRFWRMALCVPLDFYLRRIRHLSHVRD